MAARASRAGGGQGRAGGRGGLCCEVVPGAAPGGLRTLLPALTPAQGARPCLRPPLSPTQLSHLSGKAPASPSSLPWAFFHPERNKRTADIWHSTEKDEGLTVAIAHGGAKPGGRMPPGAVVRPPPHKASTQQPKRLGEGSRAWEHPARGCDLNQFDPRACSPLQWSFRPPAHFESL